MFNAAEHIRFRNRNKPAENPKLLGLTTVEINPTELCNRTCSFCPRSNPKIYPNENKHMPLWVTAKLIKDLLRSDYTGEIHITGFGEPLLHKNIVELVHICSVFHTQLITNGDRLLLNNPSYRELVNAGLSTLIVDCYDGPKQVERVTKHLRKCPITTRIRDHYDDGSNRYAEYNYTNRGGIMYPTEPLQKPCYLPFYKAFIDWDGTVRLCCNDWQRDHFFNNIMAADFSSIWMGNELSYVRRELNNSNRKNITACSKCDINGQQIGKESVQLWQTH